MCFSELDDPEQPTTFTLPASRSKNGRAHTLPLTPTMRAHHRGRAAHGVARPTVRAAQPRLHRAGPSGKAELDARSGVEGWDVHDIRRSVATRMADLGVQPHIIEQILNHQSGHKRGPAGIYNRSALRQRGAQRAGAVGRPRPHAGRGRRAQGCPLRAARCDLMPSAAVW